MDVSRIQNPMITPQTANQIGSTLATNPVAKVNSHPMPKLNIGPEKDVFEHSAKNSVIEPLGYKADVFTLTPKAIDPAQPLYATQPEVAPAGEETITLTVGKNSLIAKFAEFLDNLKKLNDKKPEVGPVVVDGGEQEKKAELPTTAKPVEAVEATAQATTAEVAEAVMAEVKPEEKEAVTEKAEEKVAEAVVADAKPEVKEAVKEVVAEKVEEKVAEKEAKSAATK